MAQTALKLKRTKRQATLKARVEQLEAEMALLAYTDCFRQLVQRVIRLETAHTDQE